MIFNLLVAYFTNLIETTGYLGVFILMLMESMIFPVPSTAVMPFAGILVTDGAFNLYMVVILTSIASLTGSLLSYYIGKYGGKPFLEKYGKYFLVHKKDIDMAERFFQTYGNWAILISRFIPVIRHVISIPAGIANMKLGNFILATLVGATTWNFILLYTGIKLGENWTMINSYSKYLDVIVVVLIILFVALFIKKHLVSNKHF